MLGERGIWGGWFRTQNEIRFAIAAATVWLDDKNSCLRCEAALINLESAVPAELDFSVDNFSVPAENQQTKAIVKRLREIGCNTCTFIQLQALADFLARGVSAENDQFVPRESGQAGQGDFRLLPVTNFPLDGPANLSAGQIAIDVTASSQQDDRQGTQNNELR